MRRATATVFTAVLLAVSAPAFVEAWVFNSYGSTMLFANDEFYITTNTQTGPVYTIQAYNTSTQKLLWDATPCEGNYNIATNFLPVASQDVYRYTCGGYTNVATAVATINVTSGAVLSKTSYAGQLSWRAGTEPVVSPTTGMYCVPIWPPTCWFANGTVLQLPGRGYAVGPHFHFYENILVVVTSEIVFYADSSTGQWLSSISEFSTDTSTFGITGGVSFLEQYTILTFFSQQTSRAYTAVLDNAAQAVRSVVQLQNVTSDYFTNLPAYPVATTGLNASSLRVSIPTYESNTATFVLKVWTVPLENGPNGNGTSELSDAPVVPISTCVALVPPKPNVKGAGCRPISGSDYLACSAWNSITGSVFNEHQYAVTSLVRTSDFTLVANLTHPAVFRLQYASVAGDMLFIAGAQSGEIASTNGQDAPYAGAAAFNKTTGAVLWEGSYLVVGPKVAYDSINACVVVLSFRGLVCVDAAGSDGSSSTSSL